jgi:hypothetical protein
MHLLPLLLLRVTALRISMMLHAPSACHHCLKSRATAAYTLMLAK